MRCEAGLSVIKSMAIFTLLMAFTGFQDEVAHRALAGPDVHHRSGVSLASVVMATMRTGETLGNNLGLFYVATAMGGCLCVIAMSRMATWSVNAFHASVAGLELFDTDQASQVKKDWRHRVVHTEMFISSVVVGYLVKQFLVYATIGQAAPADCWQYPARCVSTISDMIILSLVLIILACILVAMHFYNRTHQAYHGLNVQLHLAAVFAWLFLHMVEVSSFQVMLWGTDARSAARTPTYQGIQIAVLISVLSMVLLSSLPYLSPAYPAFTASVEQLIDCMSWMSGLLWERVLWLTIVNMTRSAIVPLFSEVFLCALALAAIAPLWWQHLVPVVCHPAPKRYDGDVSLMEVIAARPESDLRSSMASAESSSSGGSNATTGTSSAATSATSRPTNVVT